MISIDKEDSENSVDQDTKSKANHYPTEILYHNRNLNKYCKWVIIPRGGIYTNYQRSHIPGHCINVPYDHWKDKTVDNICNMHIPEGVFKKWTNNTSSILVDKVFDTTTEAKISVARNVIFGLKWIYDGPKGNIFDY